MAALCANSIGDSGVRIETGDVTLIGDLQTASNPIGLVVFFERLQA